MLGTPNTPNAGGGAPLANSTNPKEKFTTAYGLFTAGYIADSYMIFKELINNKHPAVHFNLALCQVNVGEYGEAVQNLEKAQSFLKNSGPERPKADETYSKLMRLQAENDSQLYPMKFELPILYPKITEDTILRLMADAYAEIGDNGKVENIAASLSGKGYANVERALQKVRQ